MHHFYWVNILVQFCCYFALIHVSGFGSGWLFYMYVETILLLFDLELHVHITCFIYLFSVFAGRNNSTSDDNPAITLERRKRGVIRDKLLNFVSRRPSKESLEQKGIIRGQYLSATPWRGKIVMLQWFCMSVCLSALNLWTRERLNCLVYSVSSSSSDPIDFLGQRSRSFGNVRVHRDDEICPCYALNYF